MSCSSLNLGAFQKYAFHPHPPLPILTSQVIQEVTLPSIILHSQYSQMPAALSWLTDLELGDERGECKQIIHSFFCLLYIVCYFVTVHNTNTLKSHFLGEKNLLFSFAPYFLFSLHLFDWLSRTHALATSFLFLPSSLQKVTHSQAGEALHTSLSFCLIYSDSFAFTLSSFFFFHSTLIKLYVFLYVPYYSGWPSSSIFTIKMIPCTGDIKVF